MYYWAIKTVVAIIDSNSGKTNVAIVVVLYL